MPLYPVGSLGALDIDAALGVDNFLGARRHRGGTGRRVQSHGYPMPTARQGAAMQRANRVAAIAYPDVPGSPARDAALVPAGFPVFAFTAATGLNPLIQQMNVQTPFRGQRLTVTVIRNGASALVSAPLLIQLQVGMKPINVTPNAVGLETFSSNAFDTNLLLPPSLPGTIYSMTVNLSAALAGADTLLCIVCILGTGVL